MDFGNLFFKKTKIRENPNKIKEIVEFVNENEKNPYDIINYAYLGLKKIDMELIEKIKTSTKEKRSNTKKEKTEIVNHKKEITTKELSEILNKNMKNNDFFSTNLNFNNDDEKKYSIDKKIFKLYELFNKFHNKEIANILTKTEILKRRSMDLINSNADANKTDKLKAVLQNVFNLEKLDKKVRGKRMMKIESEKKHLREKIIKKPIDSKIRKYINDKFLFYQEDINEDHINNLINEVLELKSKKQLLIKGNFDEMISSSESETQNLSIPRISSKNEHQIKNKSHKNSEFSKNDTTNENISKLDILNENKNKSRKSLNHLQSFNFNIKNNLNIKDNMNIENPIYMPKHRFSESSFRRFNTLNLNIFSNNLNSINKGIDNAKLEIKENQQQSQNPLNGKNQNHYEKFMFDPNIVEKSIKLKSHNLVSNFHKNFEDIRESPEKKIHAKNSLSNHKQKSSLSNSESEKDSSCSSSKKENSIEKPRIESSKFNINNNDLKKDNKSFQNQINFSPNFKNLKNNEENSHKRKLSPLKLSTSSKKKNLQPFNELNILANSHEDLRIANKLKELNKSIDLTLPNSLKRKNRGLEFHTHGIDETKLFSYLHEVTKNTKGKFLNYKDRIFFKTIEEFFDTNKVNNSNLQKTDNLNLNETQRTKIFLRSLMNLGHTIKSSKENENRLTRYNVDLESDPLLTHQNNRNHPGNLKSQMELPLKRERFNDDFRCSNISKMPIVYTKYSLNDTSSGEENSHGKNKKIEKQTKNKNKNKQSVNEEEYFNQDDDNKDEDYEKNKNQNKKKNKLSLFTFEEGIITDKNQGKKVKFDNKEISRKKKNSKMQKINSDEISRSKSPIAIKDKLREMSSNSNIKYGKKKTLILPNISQIAEMKKRQQNKFSNLASEKLRLSLTRTKFKIKTAFINNEEEETLKRNRF